MIDSMRDLLMVDLEEVKDKIFEEDNVDGYFVIISKSDGSIVTKYDAEFNTDFLGKMDLVLLDIRNQLIEKLKKGHKI